MPRITDFSRFSTMGVALSTCTRTTEPIWDLRKILPPLEPEGRAHQQEAAWSRYAGRSVTQDIGEATDVLSFLLWHLGVTP
jgi:hypothetical protein